MPRKNNQKEKGQRDPTLISWLEFYQGICKILHDKYTEFSKRTAYVLDEKELRKHHKKWRVVHVVERSQRISQGNSLAFLHNLNNSFGIIQQGSPWLAKYLEKHPVQNQTEMRLLLALRNLVQQSRNQLNNVASQLPEYSARLAQTKSKFAPTLDYFSQILSGEDVDSVVQMQRTTSSIVESLEHEQERELKTSFAELGKQLHDHHVHIHDTKHLTPTKARREDAHFVGEIIKLKLPEDRSTALESLFLLRILHELDEAAQSVRQWLQQFDNQSVADLQPLETYSGKLNQSIERIQDPKLATAMKDHESISHLRSILLEAEQFRKWYVQVRAGLSQSDWEDFHQFYDHISAGIKKIEKEYSDPQLAAALKEERERYHEYPKAWEDLLGKIIARLHNQAYLVRILNRANSYVQHQLATRREELHNSVAAALQSLQKILHARHDVINQRMQTAIHDLIAAIDEHMRSFGKHEDRIAAAVRRRKAILKAILEFKLFYRRRNLGQKVRDIELLITDFIVKQQQTEANLKTERLSLTILDSLAKEEKAIYMRKSQGTTLMSMKAFDLAQDRKDAAAREAKLRANQATREVVEHLTTIPQMIASMEKLLSRLQGLAGAYVDVSFADNFLSDQERSVMEELKQHKR